MSDKSPPWINHDYFHRGHSFSPHRRVSDIHSQSVRGFQAYGYVFIFYPASLRFATILSEKYTLHLIVKVSSWMEFKTILSVVVVYVRFLCATWNHPKMAILLNNTRIKLGRNIR